MSKITYPIKIHFVNVSCWRMLLHDSENRHWRRLRLWHVSKIVIHHYLLATWLKLERIKIEKNKLLNNFQWHFQTQQLRTLRLRERVRECMCALRYEKSHQNLLHLFNSEHLNSRTHSHRIRCTLYHYHYIECVHESV